MLHLASPRTVHDEEEESYFVSMSDMMVGLLFIFIIMLLYFALQFRQTTDDLTGAKNTRDKILQELKTALRNQGLEVEIDTETGVLRLPDEVLFAKGSAEVTPVGEAALGKLGRAMAAVLPCYTYSERLQPGAGCAATKHRIDAVFIEGHTDTDPIAGGTDNWDLSVRRAAQTYRAVIRSDDRLGTLKNRPAGEGLAEPVLSVSGYAETRPLPDALGDTEADKSRNRRIDLRFVMATPELSDDGRRIRQGLEGVR